MKDIFREGNFYLSLIHFCPGERQRMVLEELEHTMLGNWVHFRIHAWRGQYFYVVNTSIYDYLCLGWEEVLGYSHKRPVRVMWTEEGQGQQGEDCLFNAPLLTCLSLSGNNRVEHYVHRRPVSTFPESTLEILEDCCQQTVRVHARDARRSPGRCWQCIKMRFY